MSLSLPLRINLISLVFASLVATVLTALGGLFLHHQQAENAVNRAKLAADELVVRTRKLLDLDLRFADFIGFDEQCAAVIRNDPLLYQAGVFDAARANRFHSRAGLMRWPVGATPPEADAHLVVPVRAGAQVVRPIMRAPGEVDGYAVVAVNGGAVLGSTLRVVAWLMASALGLFVVGLLIQQRVFWRTVGRPLAALVRTADSIQPDNLSSLHPVRDACTASDDDIGRLTRAFARLIQRLLDVRAQLVAQNELLEATVHERTAELERLNAELAHDIERRKQLEGELRTLASTDALTGLANRAFILPYARQRLDHVRREGQRLGLMLFDFDGFKAINDSHGHAVGDELLRRVAQRIRRLCRNSDVVARLGGDEFLVVFEDFHNRVDAERIGRRLLTVFDDPVEVGTVRLKLGASIGVSLYPDDANEFDALMAAADGAMYTIKQRGGGLLFAAAGEPGARIVARPA